MTDVSKSSALTLEDPDFSGVEIGLVGLLDDENPKIPEEGKIFWYSTDRVRFALVRVKEVKVLACNEITEDDLITTSMSNLQEFFEIMRQGSPDFKVTDKAVFMTLEVMASPAGGPVVASMPEPERFDA